MGLYNFWKDVSVENETEDTTTRLYNDKLDTLTKSNLQKGDSVELKKRSEAKYKLHEVEDKIVDRESTTHFFVKEKENKRWGFLSKKIYD